ncbi:MAG: exo-beta-N-acetylmuramidase NamZ domain-containing protein [Myxococcota bacterium]
MAASTKIHVPRIGEGGGVVTGLERLLTEQKSLIVGKRVGLIVNQTAINGQTVHAIDLFMQDPELRLTRLFGPEHGVRGDAQDMIAVGDEKDPRSGVQVVSLYGPEETSLKPKPSDLEGLDVLVFDIQDIGSRYYTFVYTMAYCMEAAGEAGIPIIVCDRPNPIGGAQVEGNIVDMAFRSFVGRYSIPARHGMTAGELALFFRDHAGVACDLTVVTMKGWLRGDYFHHTLLPWVQPSPNMPTVETALVYPGMCLVEGTNLSEGRGTTRPFHLCGAPWVDPYALADALNAEGLPGVRWRPTYFTPMFHKHARQLCGGAEPHIYNPSTFKPFLSGLALLKHVRRLYPTQFQWRTEVYEYVKDRLAIDLLLGNGHLRQQLEDQASLAELEKGWTQELTEFMPKRASCLLYGVERRRVGF